MTQLSASQTRSVAAIGNSCVIPGERSETRDPSFDGTRSGKRNLGPGLRRGDEKSVIPAKAGIQLSVVDETSHATWAPAYARATQPR